MISFVTKLCICIYHCHYHLSSIDISFFMCYFTVVVFIFEVLDSKQQHFVAAIRNKSAIPRLNGNDVVSISHKVTTFGPRKERTKANSMRSLSSSPCCLSLSYVFFRPFFVDSKRRSTDSYSLAACRWGISSLKDSRSTVTLFVWYVILLPFATVRYQMSMFHLKALVVGFGLVGMQQKSRLQWEESRKNKEIHWLSETGLASKDASNNHQQSKLLLLTTSPCKWWYFID